MIKNCINCGAPIDSTKTKCPYCDTEYDLNGFTTEAETKNNAIATLLNHGIYGEDVLNSVPFFSDVRRLDGA